MLERHLGWMGPYFPSDGGSQPAPCGATLPDGSGNRSNLWMHVTCQGCLNMQFLMDSNGRPYPGPLVRPPVDDLSALEVWLDA